MELKYPHLFSPIKVGSLLFKNRIIAAPTSMQSLTPEGHLTDDNIAYYELKAKGGAAVVTLGESIVHAETGQSHDRQILMDDLHVIPSIANAAKAIKRHGAIANIELSHGGKYAGLASIGGQTSGESRKAYGPSDGMSDDGVRIYEMPLSMIYEIIEAWGDAAATAKMAGYDMAMVHAAHGWLFAQFLSPVQNVRTDEFGGSIENRARFMMLALDNIRSKVGRNFPIELRMNGDDYLADGLHIEDYKEIAMMVDDKVDMFNISGGIHDEGGLFVKTHPSVFLERGYHLPYTAEIKKVVKKPVACVGAISDPAHAEEIIASGQADMVEMARALLADPYLPKKAYAGRDDEITPCLRCFVCFGHSTTTRTVGCTVNPIIGNELDAKMIQPSPEKKKKILIAGGGPGGMKAALTAAERGHDIILCEATSKLGGNIDYADYVDFKIDLKLLKNRMIAQLERSNVEIRLNTKVTPALVEEIKPDALVIAIGAKPFVPNIPGIDGDNVVQAIEIEMNPDRFGKKIAILGGGLVGSEAAISLTRSGKEVTLIEMREDIAMDVNEFHKMALDQEVEKIGLDIRTNTTAKSIEKDGITVINKDGNEEFITADAVVLAAGLSSRSDEMLSLMNITPEYFIIGDCVSPRQVTQAISEGYYAMRNV